MHILGWNSASKQNGNTPKDSFEKKANCILNLVDWNTCCSQSGLSRDHSYITYISSIDESEPRWLELRDFQLGSWTFPFSSKKNSAWNWSKGHFFNWDFFSLLPIHFQKTLITLFSVFLKWILFLLKITDFLVQELVKSNKSKSFELKKQFIYIKKNTAGKYKEK